MNIKAFPTDDVAVTSMIRDVLSREGGSREGQSTYLRSLVAAAQEALGSEPVLAPGRRPKKVQAEQALNALEAVHGRFYGIVLQEVNSDGLDARTRNAQTGFARSAASTLRTAVRYGLNPLTLVLTAVTKESLRSWTREHQPEVHLGADEASKKANSLLDEIAALIESVPEDERAEVIEAMQAKMETLDAMSSPERFAKQPERTAVAA